MAAKTVERRSTLWLLTSLILLQAGIGSAQEDSAVDHPSASIATLPPVTVIGHFANPASGQSVIDREVLQRLPAGNGSINEALALFPDVQLAEDARSTANAGEILPPRFSIAGGKTYQNRVLIDGVGSESFLDPAATVSDVNNVPGHPQALFPGIHLAESITVFDSNIPARYGGFTGGVVAIDLRDPQPEAAGHLFYRTTRAEWTRFHLDAGETVPDFSKQQGGFDFDLPLTTEMGLLGSYGQIHSRIPVPYFGGTAVQSRRKEDWFFKYAWQLPEGDLRLAFLATPYEAENVMPNVLASRYTLAGGGTQLQIDYEQLLPVGEWRLQASWQESWNHRRAPADLRAWALTERHFWGQLIGKATSMEGGYGDIDREQRALAMQTSLALEPIHQGRVVHAPEVGLELETVRGAFERRETTRIYTAAKVEPTVICGADAYACSDEEQYFTTRITYPRGRVAARLQRTALYLQDELTVARLGLRPGLRFSYDDFMDNFDTAPRLAATLDLFGARQTLLIGGYNRYYGQPLLTYKLREAQTPETYEYRGTSQDFVTAWQAQSDRLGYVSRYSRLDTPYSDEVTAGIDQALFGGRLSLKYVRRDNKREFAREEGALQPDGLRVSILTNRGESRHESARIGWERTWPRDFLSVNATWQESSASNEDYDSILDAEDVTARVWLDDRLRYASELPRRDYNRPWTVNLVYTGRFPLGFSFTNVARYRSGYRKIIDTRTTREVPGGAARLNPVTGEIVPESLPVYAEEKLSGGVIFDWRLAWQSPGERSLVLSLEVNNVFDTRLETGAVRQEYEIGRQFWGGAEWNF